MTTVSHSYPLSLPSTPAPRDSQLVLRRSVAMTQSAWSFATEVQKHPGAMWAAHFEYPPMTRAQIADWQQLSDKLQGMFGTVLVGDPDAKTPRGNPSGTPVVDGASQTGNQINTRGWTALNTGLLLKGDYIQIGQYMYRVVDDSVDSDSAGDATITFEPSLRASPADGTSITTSNCVTKMRLASNDIAFAADMMSIYGLSLDFFEAL